MGWTVPIAFSTVTLDACDAPLPELDSPHCGVPLLGASSLSDALVTMVAAALTKVAVTAAVNSAVSYAFRRNAVWLTL